MRMPLMDNNIIIDQSRSRSLTVLTDRRTGGGRYGRTQGRYRRVCHGHG